MQSQILFNASFTVASDFERYVVDTRERINVMKQEIEKEDDTFNTIHEINWDAYFSEKKEKLRTLCNLAGRV